MKMPNIFHKGISKPVASVVIVAFALLAFGGAVGYNFWRQRETLSVEQTSTEDKTVGWQTYRNEEWGFEIDYPIDGWAFSGQSNNPVFWIEKSMLPDGQPDVCYVSGRIAWVDPKCYGGTWGKQVSSKIFQCIIDQQFSLVVEDNVITNYQADGFIGEGGGTTFGRFRGAVFPLVKNTQDYYPILIVSYDLDVRCSEEDMEDFDRVVSSFRIIESGLDYQSIMEQMFPEGDFTEVAAQKDYFQSDLDCTYSKPCTYYIANTEKGFFAGPQKESLLVIVRRPSEELAHVEGFQRSFAAVFDEQGKQILSETKLLEADRVEFRTYNCQEGTFIFFLVSSTFQGYSTFYGGLYKMRNGKFEEVWPKGENFWLNKSLEFEGNNIKIYELEYGLHTEAKLIYLYSLAWDSGSCALTER